MCLAMKQALFLGGSAYRAGLGANAAFDALVSVDDVLAVAFGNGFLGAFAGAGAAHDAFIGNFVSHNDTSVYVRVILHISFILSFLQGKRKWDGNFLYDITDN